MTSLANWNSTVGVLFPKLLWVLDMMNFGGKIPAELTESVSAL